MGTMKEVNKKKGAPTANSESKNKIYVEIKHSLSESGNEFKSQKDKIVKYIRDFGSITTRDAFLDLGIYRLASRIHELRKIFDVHDCWETAHNRYGEKVRYKRYAFYKKYLSQKGEQK